MTLMARSLYGRLVATRVGYYRTTRVTDRTVSNALLYVELGLILCFSESVFPQRPIGKKDRWVVGNGPRRVLNFDRNLYNIVLLKQNTLIPDDEVEFALDKEIDLFIWMRVRRCVRPVDSMVVNLTIWPIPRNPFCIIPFSSRFEGTSQKL